MKLPKKPAASSVGAHPEKVTNVTPVNGDLGIVEISHSQTIRQSLNYQSAEVSYGVKVRCLDNPKAIKSTVERAELIVEVALLPKFKDHADLLNQLAKGR